MEARYLRRKNDDGVEEKFYPITHVNAVVGMSELRDDIESITNGKVNVNDIIDNLTTNVANKPLSAAQGVVINGLIETLQTSINGKAASDHTHSAKDVGALSKVYVSHDDAGNVTLAIS